jgi:hypothetical protein
VELDRFVAQAEGARDLFVRQPIGQERQDLQFARREGFDERRLVDVILGRRQIPIHITPERPRGAQARCFTDDFHTVR